MDSNYEVVSHGFSLPQLVGVAVVHHVVTARQRQISIMVPTIKAHSVQVNIYPTHKGASPVIQPMACDVYMTSNSFKLLTLNRDHVKGAIRDSLVSS